MRLGRTILAVLAGYIANGILVAVTEGLLSRYGLSATSPSSLEYFVVDLITQCIYTVAGGYLCHVVARSSGKAALAGLIGVAMVVGTISLVTSWSSQPHGYGIALLAVYPPCAWAGWMLRRSPNT